MTEKRFTTVELPKPTQWGIWYDGAYLSTYQICILLNEYVDAKKENEQLKQFQEKVAEVIESKMGDNVCNDYKMEVLKEIWNELELDEVWFE